MTKDILVRVRGVQTIGEEEDTQIVWGVGIDTSIVTSSLKAIISAINRSER